MSGAVFVLAAVEQKKKSVSGQLIITIKEEK